jgi:allophanate hydrolase subunit 2
VRTGSRRLRWPGCGGGEFRVSAESNRIGLRTEAGPPLVRARTGELPSEGMVPGAVQVPPDGLPVVFLADHPVTGGYPVVGVVPPGPALDAAARARPGAAVRFVAVR